MATAMSSLDLQAVRAAELLAVQEQAAQAAQLGDVRCVAPSQEGVARQRQLPDRIGNGATFDGALLAALAQPLPPAAHQPARRRLQGQPHEAVAAQPQHLGARRRVVEIPVAQHQPLEARRQCRSARAMGVAMHHLRGAGGAQAGHRGCGIQVGPPASRRRLAAAGFAGVADAGAELHALGQRPRQEIAPAWPDCASRRETAGRRRRPGTARRHASAARRWRQARSRVGSASACTPMPCSNVGGDAGNRGCRPSARRAAAAPRRPAPGCSAASKSSCTASEPSQNSNRSPRMKIASAGVPRMYAAQASKVRGRASLRCRSEMKSIACQRVRRHPLGGRRQHAGSGSHHRRSARLRRFRPRARSSPPPAARRRGPRGCRCAPSRSRRPRRCPRPRGRRPRSPSPARFRP